MLNIIAFGEALIDMMPDGGADRPIGAPPRAFVPYPGGAPANVAVATARLGTPTWFVGQVGRDIFGDMIADTLSRYGVTIDHLTRSDEAQTPLAFVAHDSHGERRFSFYRQATADLMYRSDQTSDAIFASGGIFHICSNTLTEPSIEATTHALLQRAGDHGCLCCIDVNFRASLWHRSDQAPAVIWQCLRRADLVKISREELHELYGSTDEKALINALIDEDVRLVVITDGGNPLRYATASHIGTIEPPSVDVVDTTAAGDAFVGGVLNRLANALGTNGTFEAFLRDESALREVLGFAARCGAFTAGRYGAYDALPTAEDLN